MYALRTSSEFSSSSAVPPRTILPNLYHIAPRGYFQGFPDYLLDQQHGHSLRYFPSMKLKHELNITQKKYPCQRDTRGDTRGYPKNCRKNPSFYRRAAGVSRIRFPPEVGMTLYSGQ
jgi:hypothetical protein